MEDARQWGWHHSKMIYLTVPRTTASPVLVSDDENLNFSPRLLGSFQSPPASVISNLPFPSIYHLRDSSGLCVRVLDRYSPSTVSFSCSVPAQVIPLRSKLDLAALGFDDTSLSFTTPPLPWSPYSSQHSPREGGGVGDADVCGSERNRQVPSIL